MRNYGKKKNYCLIAALASLVAFSTMAASVMSRKRMGHSAKSDKIVWNTERK